MLLGGIWGASWRMLRRCELWRVGVRFVRVGGVGEAEDRSFREIVLVYYIDYYDQGNKPVRGRLPRAISDLYPCR
jgi:lipoprotein signal peptidase